MSARRGKRLERSAWAAIAVLALFVQPGLALASALCAAEVCGEPGAACCCTPEAAAPVADAEATSCCASEAALPALSNGGASGACDCEVAPSAPTGPPVDLAASAGWSEGPLRAGAERSARTPSGPPLADLALAAVPAGPDPLLGGPPGARERAGPDARLAARRGLVAALSALATWRL